MIFVNDNDNHFFLEELFSQEFRDLVNLDLEDVE